MKKLKIITLVLCLYVSNTVFAVIPGFPKTEIDLGIGGAFSSTTQTTGCVATGSSAAITFTPTCGSFGAGTSNFSTSTKFFSEPGNSGAVITSQNATTGNVTFQMVSYLDAGAGERRYPTGRIYVDYVCRYDSTYIVGTCSGGIAISTTVHLSRSGRAHIDFFQTFTASIATQIVGPDCVKNGEKVTYSIFDFMSGPITNRDHYRWTKPGPNWTVSYYSYDSSSITLVANTVNPGDVLTLSIGDCNTNFRTKPISSPGVVPAPSIVKNYCINNPSTASTWNVAFTTTLPAPSGIVYSWDIASSGAGFTYASGNATTQGPISVNIGSTPSGYILFKSSKVVGSGCPNAERIDTIRFSRAFPGTITGPTCVTVGVPQTYTVTGVPATTSITWNLPSGVTPTGTVTTTGSSITLTPTSSLNYGSINAIAAPGACAGTITGLNSINPIPTLTAISGPVCVARNANVIYNATASGYDNISWTSFSGTVSSASNTFNTTAPSNFTGGVISAVAVKGLCTSTSVSYPVKWDASGINLTSLTATKTCLSNGVSQTVTYTTDAGYDTYTWNLPAGWSGTSTTNTITYTTNGTAGTVSVTAKNGTCGSTNSKSLTVPFAPTVVVTNSGVVNGVVTLSVPTGFTYQWYKNIPKLDGATSNFLILPVTGTVNNSYCVEVTNSSGCVTRACSNSTSNPAARIGNIDETENTDATSIVTSPNPANKLVDIKFGSALAGQPYSVVNVNGQVMTSGTFVTGSTLDVSTWPDGMYILRSGNTTVKIQVAK